MTEFEESGLDPKALEVTRRQILRSLGGGILVFALAPDILAFAQRGGQRPTIPQEVDAWVHIGTDGRIGVMTGKVEVGQNARTMLTQAAAEELLVPPESIHLTMGDTDLVPFDMGTFGSRTTPTMVPQIRKAAAAAREALLGLAAAKWGVDRASLKLEQGRVTTADGKRSASYGELARGQKLETPISDDTPLTPISDWRTLGTSLPKIGARDIVTGKHTYASDLSRPGMLYAKVLRAPSFGATLESLNTQDAEAIAGVKVFRDGSFVAVAAPRLRDAERALEMLKARWSEKPQPSNKELFALLTEGAEKQALPAGAHMTLQGRYTAEFIAHAPLETRAALAEWDGKKLTVHTGTQRPFGVRGEVASALGIPEAQVRVLVPDTGSGYGGKHSGDAAVEAARIAKALGVPIKLVWTRREEFTHAYVRPAGVVEIASGVDAGGKLDHWQFDNYNSGGAGLGCPYGVADPRVEHHERESPLRQGSYRALATTFNNFSRETHMDELAHALGLDPLEFRLRNLSEPRLRAVLEAAAKGIGWGGAKPPKGRGFGIACGTDKGSVVASAVEVEVDSAIRVLRIVNAFECGKILNPDHLKSQVDGGILMGLGGALFERVEFANGRILSDGFSKYRVPRFSDMPPMETLLLDRPDLPSVGGGETPIIALAPAIGNAVFAATGKRLRDLPLTL
ncbi:MAG TPA: molybdopterin cofactor-binding domain-containing protein [Fimbriimonas sp.]